mmetsp:Transcript_23429/g.53272  ORF Transcript_23429/g.53272 Transcript_23429/m.53272 type:complete len:213 (+) Transcript_23429:262-900(+)
MTRAAPSQKRGYWRGGAGLPPLALCDKQQSFAMRPDICSNVSNPSSTRIWVKPISLMKSNFSGSDISSNFVTRNSVPTISRPQYPSVHISSTIACAFSYSESMHACNNFLIMSGCGWSQTLNTFSLLMKPKPACVACALLSACRISPSAVNMRASRPPSLLETFSACRTSCKRFRTCWSVSFEYLRTAQRDCIGSIIFSDMLHASAKRVVLE